MAIKIPQRDDRTVLQSTAAARPRVSGPAAPAYNAQEMQALQRVSDGLGKAGGMLFDLQQRQRALDMAAFESDAQMAAKKYADDLANSNDYLSFAQKYNDFEKNIQTMGKERLGETEYGNWAATRGKLFMGSIQLDTAQQTAQKKSVALKDELASSLNNWATLASLANTPQALEMYGAQARAALEDAYSPKDGGAPLITEEEKLGLQDRFDRAVGEATLLQDVKNNPSAALNNLKNPEMYTFFTPQERQRWIGDVSRGMEAVKGTAKEKPVDDFLTYFNRLRQGNPTAAGVLYDQFVNRPADMQAEYGLTAQQVGTARTYMKGSLEDGDAGAEKQNNFAEVNVRYNLLGLDEKGIFHEKKGEAEFEPPKLEEMTQLMTDIEAYMGSGGFVSSDRNKAVDLMNGLRYALGRQVKENTVELAEKADGWFTQGVSEYVQSKTVELLKRAYGEKNLPENAVADLYFATYGGLQKRRMNLKSQSNEDKTVAREVLRQTWNTLIANKYVTDPEKVGAVLGKEGALVGDSSAVDPEAFKLTAPKGYEAENVDGRIVLVRRDKDGNIIDQIAASFVSGAMMRGF